ncbi:protein transport protein sec31-like [Miscanthus floridulus]|uniref:protein transport protein sec31-like n=1 Tax=Miscanthus floridulus TaxID=154761 RepID=UPI0034586403
MVPPLLLAGIFSGQQPLPDLHARPSPGLHPPAAGAARLDRPAASPPDGTSPRPRPGSIATYGGLLIGHRCAGAPGSAATCGGIGLDRSGFLGSKRADLGDADPELRPAPFSAHPDGSGVKRPSCLPSTHAAPSPPGRALRAATAASRAPLPPSPRAAVSPSHAWPSPSRAARHPRPDSSGDGQIQARQQPPPPYLPARPDLQPPGRARRWRPPLPVATLASCSPLPSLCGPRASLARLAGRAFSGRPGPKNGSTGRA